MKTWQEYVKAAMFTATERKSRELEGMIRMAGLCGEGKELKDALTVMFGANGYQTRYAYRNPQTVDSVTKELGDYLWYLAALWDWCDFTTGYTARTIDLGHYQAGCFARGEAGPEFKSAPLDCAGLVAEAMKKHIGHDKPFNPVLFESLLFQCLTAAVNVANVAGLNIGEVCQANITKLRARFHGGKFDSAMAAAKADEVVKAQRNESIGYVNPTTGEPCTNADEPSSEAVALAAHHSADPVCVQAALDSLAAK